MPEQAEYRISVEPVNADHLIDKYGDCWVRRSDTGRWSWGRSVEQAKGRAANPDWPGRTWERLVTEYGPLRPFYASTREGDPLTAGGSDA